MTFESPLAAYRHALEQGGFQPEPAQRHAVDCLQACHEALHRAGEATGVYLWGPVGRGKTWLMDRFHQSLKVPARRQHFHHFMRWVHQRLFQLTGTPDPLRALARELAEEVRVLCFDELFVNDIGDAMLLGRLLRAMFEEGVAMVATSNQPPRQLYADGFNRERFLRRYRSQIKSAVAGAIRGRSITDMQSGEKITIPAKDIREPSFGHGRGGIWERVPAGASLVREGERGDFFCVLVDGEMRVTKNKKVLTVLGAGECFGDAVHHHILTMAKAEWHAFNQTVTDWELRRYFERG